ncbi:testis-expressed protein 2 isoform X1 [Diprion similis]|uniref:testis-expressed protein 2 isoform X1 n=2 Tax=Diprion similis TaxID=362088 RepID=UPI001EF8DE92|nr:testis-expressed protein 2 isoform X1 [Diprion similis]XP_046734748.1 testis-expressed protein 2 isoform X1 [Diprion similis]XP_046734749.1 testis-expressed protein 2 isoform X1 [Diprion similis]
MSSKPTTPGKVTLGMLKGKPIMTSVPVIRYHASDDELEELYPSTDDEELYTPESEHPSTKSSPCKTSRNRSEDELGEGTSLGRRSASVDGNLSEGTPPTDPWKMLSEIKGKITKTFEEKISEIKSERKKKKRRSKDNSSVSDSEDLADITPTEDNLSEQQELEPSSPIKFSKNRSARFTGFYNIKTGLKTKNSEEDSVESGIEAAELAEDDSLSKSNLDDKNLQALGSSDGCKKLQTPLIRLPLNAIEKLIPQRVKSEPALTQLFKKIIYQLISLPIILLGAYHVIPLPEYIVGLIAGIFVTITIQRVLGLVTQTLMTPQKIEDVRSGEEQVSVLEIPAVEEHVVVDRFEGWLNQLPYSYDPDNYHVARTVSVYFRLEGGSLKVMETKTRIPKREVWDEPKQKVRYIWKKVYTLADATIKLLPEGLIRRRRWSKKYPICITFSKDALIESSSLNETSEDEILQKIGVDEDGTIHEEDETDEDLSKDSKEAKDGFEDCTDESGQRSKMYIFARTDRQKEDWFRRLNDAVNTANKRGSLSSINEIILATTSPTVQGNNESKNSVTTVGSSEIPHELSYNAYMAMYTEMTTNATSDSENREKSNVIWMNALVGRILYDMHKCPETISLIQDKIQRKMSNIKLPYFMESLLVSELVIGQGAPVIHKASQPVLDQRGLWLDLDISYEGCLTMTTETKVNLMKLTRAGSISSNASDLPGTDKLKPARSPMFDSDVEDSPETSTEEEDNTHVTVPNTSRDSTPPQSSGRRFLNMVDKLAANKYFQHATEIRYIRRAMEGFSNKEIRLMVTVSSIEGCLVLNIPPPPSDRLWYGFKTVPKISLTAKPALGEKPVNLTYITSLIENKLLREFEKLVVLPNMDDLVISLCPNYPYVS